MSDQPVHFTAGGLRLAGIVRTPATMAPGERRPAFLVLHGFGSHKGAGNVLVAGGGGGTGPRPLGIPTGLQRPPGTPRSL